MKWLGWLLSAAALAALASVQGSRHADIGGAARAPSVETGHELGDRDSSGSLSSPIPSADRREAVLQQRSSDRIALVTGRVVDARGRPVTGARIWVECLESEKGAWQGRSDADGLFELDSEPSESRHSMQAAHDEFLSSADVEFLPGASGVVLVLEDAASLEGRLRVPERIRLDSVKVEIVSTEHYGWCGQPYGARLTRTDDGRFEGLGVRPGKFELLVGFDSWTVVRREIELRAGTRTDLGDIDLRGLVHAIEVELVDESGERLEGEVVVLEGDDSVRSWPMAPDRRVAWPSDVAAPSLIAVSEGRRARRFDSVRDGDRLVLDRGIPARLELAQDLPALDPGVSIRIELRYQGEDVFGLALGTSSGELDPTGHGEILVPRAGPYSLAGWVVRSEPFDWFDIDDERELVIEVPEHGSTHALSLDPAALEEALREARDP